MRLLIATRDGDHLYQTGVTTTRTVLGSIAVPYGVVELEDGTTFEVEDVRNVLARGYWEIVADTITDDAMHKERPRQFGSRSEAGRYAAHVRWGTRGGGAPTATHAASPEGEPTFDLSTAILEGRPYAPLMRENFPPDIQKDLDTVQMWWQQKNIGADPENGPTEEEMAVLREASARVRPRLQEHFEQHLDMSGLTPEARAAVEKAGVTNKWYRELLNNEEITVQEHYGTTRVRARTLTAQYMASEYSHVMYKEGLSTGLDGKTQREGTSKVAADMDAITHMGTKAVTVTVPSKVVGAILTNGGLKNQFSSRSSGGYKNYDSRALSEMTAFGTHPLTIPSKRPVYGSIHPFGVRHPKQNGCEQYGDVQIVLKPSTQARTTFSPHDSLLMGRLHNPLSGPTKPITYSGWDTDGKTQLGHARDGTKTPWYIEAQIHGGVTLADIAFIAAPKGGLGENVLKRLAKAGIEVKDLPDETEGFPVVKSMRRLIATSGDRTLYQTGFTTLWAGTVLENQAAAGVIVENGTEIEVSSIGSVLARGYWDIIADTVEPVDKGRPRQFSSRSEAGRYAAQIRWGNRTQGATSGHYATGAVLEPTDDPNEAILTGRPFAPLLPENLPLSVRAEMEAFTKVGAAGISVVPTFTPQTQEELVKHLLEATDPAKLSPETIKTLRQKGVQSYYEQITDPADHTGYRQKWAADAAAFYAMGAIESGYATSDKQKGALKATQDVVADKGRMRLAVSVDAVALIGVGKSGEFKTQFSRNMSSNGLYQPTIRSTHEAVAHGTHPATMPDKRPVYGTVSPLGIRSSYADGTAQYGTVRLVLKREVAARTTFTVHDSLGMNRHPAPVNGPITRPQASPYMGTHTSPTRRLKAIRGGEQHDYAEIQVHGGLKLSDVSHIVLDVDAGGKPRKALVDFAKKHGLELIVVERPPSGNKGKGYGVIDDSALQKMLDAMEKGRQRQFGSRSEAGRYAAQIRWGNRNRGAISSTETYVGEDADMEALRGEIAVAAAAVGAINESNTAEDYITLNSIDQYDTETRYGLFDDTTNDEPIPTKPLADANNAVLAVGTRVENIAIQRLAARGITRESSDQQNTDEGRAKVAEAANAKASQAALEYNTFIAERAPFTAEWHAKSEKLRERKEQAEEEARLANHNAKYKINTANFNEALNLEMAAVIGKVTTTGTAPSFEFQPQKGERVAIVQKEWLTAAQGTIAEVVPSRVVGAVSAAQPKMHLLTDTVQGAGAHWNPDTQEIGIQVGYTLQGPESHRQLGHEYGHSVQSTFRVVSMLEAAEVSRRIRLTPTDIGAGVPSTRALLAQKPLAGGDRKGFGKDQFKDSFVNEYSGYRYQRVGGVLKKGNPFKAVWGTEQFPITEMFSTGVESLTTRKTSYAVRPFDQGLRNWSVGVLLTLDATLQTATKGMWFDMDKAKQFGSRSEAGRYAAQVRWGNRGADAKPAAPTKTKDLKTLQQTEAEATAIVNDGYPDDPNDLFTEEEQLAAEDYMGASSWLNSDLRRGEIDDDYADTVYDLESAIAKAPPLKQAAVVYRGLETRKMDARVVAKFQNLKVGQQFEDDGFCSTSVRAGVAARFAGSVTMEIVLPAGTRALSMDKIVGIVSGRKESEVVLDRGTRFKVLAKSQTDSGKTLLRVTPVEVGLR